MAEALLRSSSVMCSARFLPPSLPPLRPIAAITREISDLVGAFTSTGPFSSVLIRTRWCASWFTSGSGSLRIRLGIPQACHVPLRPSIPPKSKVAHYQAEAIVQDAGAYQRLLDIAARADAREGIRQGLDESRQGKGRDAEAFFAEFEGDHGLSG